MSLMSEDSGPISFCIVLFVLILHLSSVQSIYCRKAFECSNQTTSYNKTITLWNVGYKSHFSSLSSITSGSIYCSAAFACAEVSSISMSSLVCSGDSSCSKVSNIYREPSLDPSLISISVGGVNGLIHSTVSSVGNNSLLCNGEQSCAHSLLSGFSSIDGRGAYSLLNTTIDSVNATMNISINFAGYYAGFNTFITCRSGQTCNIQCYSSGCNNIYLNCSDNCVINGTINHIVSIQGVLFYDSFIISQQNDASCSAQVDEMNFDDYYERYDPLNVLDALDNLYGGPICCRAHGACFANNIRYASFANESVVCSGAQSCDSSSIYNKYGPIFCGGAWSCFNANITTTGILYCNAFSSCHSSFISRPSRIYCTAYESCDSTSIISNGTDLSLYFTGFASGKYANVTCSESDKCYIHCHGYEACDDTNLVCDGTCSVYCDAYSMCPNGWNSTPIITTFAPIQSTIASTIPFVSESAAPSILPTIMISTLDQSTLVNTNQNVISITGEPTPVNMSSAITESADKLSTSSPSTAQRTDDLPLIIAVSSILLCLLITCCLILIYKRIASKKSEVKDNAKQDNPPGVVLNAVRLSKIEENYCDKVDDESLSAMEGMKMTQEGAPDDDDDIVNIDDQMQQTTNHESDNIAGDEFVVKGEDETNNKIQ